MVLVWFRSCRLQRVVAALLPAEACCSAAVSSPSLLPSAGMLLLQSPGPAAAPRTTHLYQTLHGAPGAAGVGGQPGGAALESSGWRVDAGLVDAVGP